MSGAVNGGLGPWRKAIGAKRRTERDIRIGTHRDWTLIRDGEAPENSSMAGEGAGVWWGWGLEKPVLAPRD